MPDFTIGDRVTFTVAAYNHMKQPIEVTMTGTIERIAGPMTTVKTHLGYSKVPLSQLRPATPEGAHES